MALNVTPALPAQFCVSRGGSRATCVMLVGVLKEKIENVYGEGGVGGG